MLQASFLPLLFFTLSYGIVILNKGWMAGLYTTAVGVLVLLSFKLIHFTEKTRKNLAYLIFFITPLLTAIGQIGTLTGFGRSGISLPWQGIAFATSGIAFQIYQGKLTFSHLFGSILQPLRLISGPLAVSFAPLKKLNLPRFQIYLGWIILGSFFYCVLAAGIAPLLLLRQSTESLDVLTFAIIFELYVYLNFCGISLVVLGVLNLMGARTTLNFNAPFSARNLIGYWQRWHISFSTVLKTLFFQPSQKIAGTSFAVMTVFIASSMWHGISLNFFMWGIFHALGWLLTYHLARIDWIPFKKAIQALLLIVFVIVGRLIFSEDDFPTLLIKLTNLFNFKPSSNALVLNMSLDSQTLLIIMACCLIILLEILAPKKMVHYKILRSKWVLFILLCVTLAFGSTGLFSVYGVR